MFVIIIYRSKNYLSLIIIIIIANIQNICNLIGREEYNIGRTVLLVSMLNSLTNEKKFNFRGGQNRNLLI